MSKQTRDRDTFEKLVKVAKAQAEDMRAVLADIETARASAETSLDWLEQSVRQEELRAADMGPAGPAAFARFLDAARRRRANIEASIEQFRAKEEDARIALQEAFGEVRKLEIIAERRQVKAAKDDRKAEDAALSDLSAARAGR